MQQQAMIARVRALCQTDRRVSAAMMYGSFTYAEGDSYSDIEFLLFFEDDAYKTLNQRAWLDQIAPVAALYTNDYGIQAVIFDNLVRGEFHFHRISDVTIGATWKGVITFPTLDSTLIVDKAGRLTPYLEPIIGPPIDFATPDTLQRIAHQFANQFVFGFSVWQRGEHARTLEMLNIIHRQLLSMARALEGATAHWLTPSRALEQDLSPAAYARFATCTAALDRADQGRALANCWTWGREMLVELETRWSVTLPVSLLDSISARVNAVQSR